MVAAADVGGWVAVGEGIRPAEGLLLCVEDEDVVRLSKPNIF
jgi:hypothetical protein